MCTIVPHSTPETLPYTSICLSAFYTSNVAKILLDYQLKLRILFAMFSMYDTIIYIIGIMSAVYIMQSIYFQQTYIVGLNLEHCYILLAYSKLLYSSWECQFTELKLAIVSFPMDAAECHLIIEDFDQYTNSSYTVKILMAASVRAGGPYCDVQRSMQCRVSYWGEGAH